jgi:iron complex transport system substrate-binding protein
MYGRRSSRGLAKAWAILLVVLIVAGISAGFLLTQFWPSAPSGPKYTTVVDMTGKAVNVPAPVSKAVVLQSYWAEVACLLGGGDKIVGISKSVQDSIWIPDSLKNRTVVGDIFTGVNLETVVALKPDVVITDTGYGKAEEIIKALEGQGIPVVRMFCRSFDDQLKAIRIIGKVFGSESKAEELVNYLSSKFNEIKSIASKIPENEKPKILMLSSIKEGLVSTYSNSTWGRAVEDVGGINLAYRNIPSQAWPKVNVETVLGWNPEIIIVVTWDEKTLSQMIQVLTKDPWNKTTAAKSGRIYGVLAGGKCREAFLDWGPRMLIGYMQLAKIVQPKYFKDLDWRKEADELLTKFYGVKKYVIVKDVRGKEVMLPYPVERAVVIQGYEITAALGAFNKVVGSQEYVVKRDRTIQRVVPNIKDIPIVGTSSSVNMEMLLSLRPEVVITWDVYPKVIEDIESAGIPVVAIRIKNLTSLEETIRLLGKIFGKEKRAEEIISLMNEVINFVRDRTKEIPSDQKLRALYLYSPKTLNVWGWGTTHAQIFELAGLIDVTKGKMPPPGYGQVPLETIIEWNPDIIFLAPRVWCRCTAEDIYNDVKWQQINAVKNHRVYQLPLMSSWSPEFATLSLFYASKAYPDRFKDVDFDEFYREFTKKVYGVPLEPYYGE